MGIYIHAGSLCLLKKHFQVPQVMAGNQDSGACSHTDIDFGDLRISKGLCICLVQQGHAGHAVPAGLQSQGYQVISGKGVIQR